MQKEMNKDVIGVRRLGFDWYSFLDLGCKCIAVHFKRQTALIVNPPDSIAAQLASDFPLAWKIRCDETLDDFCLCGSRWAELLLDVHAISTSSKGGQGNMGATNDTTLRCHDLAGGCRTESGERRERLSNWNCGGFSWMPAGRGFWA